MFISFHVSFILYSSIWLKHLFTLICILVQTTDLYHSSVTNGRPTTDAHIGLILHKDSSENVMQKVVDELLNDSLKR